MTKSKHRFIRILAVLFVFHLLGMAAQQAPDDITIQLVTTFDYPASGTSTVPEGINDQGDIAGILLDADGATSGFVRFHSGVFSAPIIDPNDFASTTEVRGINQPRVVGGFYNNPDGLSHGFLLRRGIFTDFRATGSNNTMIEGLNDAGDFVGAFDSPTAEFVAFSDIGGTQKTIDVPGAFGGYYAFGINKSREITGQYTDRSGIVHGWWQDSTGTVNAPFDPPGALQTLAFGINNQAYIVGRFTDATTLVERGFLFNTRKGSYVIFDGPAATFTSLNGINTDGLICGRYADQAGAIHGLLARVVTGRGSVAPKATVTGSHSVIR